MRNIVHRIVIFVALVSPLASVSPFSSPLAEPFPKILKGVIKSQGAIDVKGFNLFFGGQQTLTDAEGFFSFKLEFLPAIPLYLLISEGARWTFDKANTIAALSQDSQKPYLFYVINYIKNEQGIRTLVATPERLDGARNFQIPPECCIVLPLDPNTVARLEPWKSPAEAVVASLPKIVLKDLPRSKISTVDRNALESLVHRPTHERPSGTTKVVQNQAHRPQSVRISA